MTEDERDRLWALYKRLEAERPDRFIAQDYTIADLLRELAEIEDDVANSMIVEERR